MKQGGGEGTGLGRTEIWAPTTLVLSGLIHYAQGPGRSPPEAPGGRKSFTAAEEEEGTAGGLQGHCGPFSIGLSLPEGAGQVPHIAFSSTSSSQPRLSPLPW